MEKSRKKRGHSYLREMKGQTDRKYGNTIVSFRRIVLYYALSDKEYNQKAEGDKTCRI